MVRYRIVKAFWGLSLLLFLAVLLFVYAFLPGFFKLPSSWNITNIQPTKSGFFYFLLGLSVTVNLLIYLIGKLRDLLKIYKKKPKDLDFTIWITGMAGLINLLGSALLVQVMQVNELYPIPDLLVKILLFFPLILMVIWTVYLILQKVLRS
jgi:hypothetical protein